MVTTDQICHVDGSLEQQTVDKVRTALAGRRQHGYQRAVRHMQHFEKRMAKDSAHVLARLRRDILGRGAHQFLQHQRGRHLGTGTRQIHVARIALAAAQLKHALRELRHGHHVHRRIHDRAQHLDRGGAEHEVIAAEQAVAEHLGGSLDEDEPFRTGQWRAELERLADGGGVLRTGSDEHDFPAANPGQKLAAGVGNEHDG